MPLEFAYWPLRGLGNPTRFCLEYLGLDYNETRYDDKEKWLSEKFQLGLDFPNLPYLIDGEVKLSQSGAILRYLADKHGLHGKDAKDRAHLEMLAFECVDIHQAIGRAVYNPDFENLKDELHQTLTTKLEQVVKFLDGKKFFGGEEVMFPDFHFYEVLFTATKLFPDLTEKFPAVKAYMERFEALPKIAAYMASSKYMEGPFFGPMAKWGGWKE